MFRSPDNFVLLRFDSNVLLLFPTFWLTFILWGQTQRNLLGSEKSRHNYVSKFLTRLVLLRVLRKFNIWQTEGFYSEWFRNILLSFVKLLWVTRLVLLRVLRKFNIWQTEGFYSEWFRNILLSFVKLLWVRWSPNNVSKSSQNAAMTSKRANEKLNINQIKTNSRWSNPQYS